MAQKQDRVRRLEEHRVARELAEPVERRNSKPVCDSNAATAQSSEACTAIVPVVAPPMCGVCLRVNNMVQCLALAPAGYRPREGDNVDVSREFAIGGDVGSLEKGFFEVQMEGP